MDTHVDNWNLNSPMNADQNVDVRENHSNFNGHNKRYPLPLQVQNNDNNSYTESSAKFLRNGTDTDINRNCQVMATNLASRLF